MFGDIHTKISLCDLMLTVHSISRSKPAAGAVKAYYQHRHPGFEIHYISTGQSKVNCDGKTYCLNAGSLLLVPPEAYHDVVDIVGDTSRVSICFSLDKPKPAKPGSKADGFAQAFHANAPTAVNLQNTEAQTILGKMEALLVCTAGDPYRKDKLITLCCGLMLELACRIAGANDGEQTYPDSQEPPDADFMIDRFLGRNFMCNDGMPRMAEGLHVSTRQLHRIIKDRYGTNYRQKLSETRIKIAVDLLCNTDMPIHKIAEKLGYSSSSNFSAFLKRCTNQTPSQIRKNGMPLQIEKAEQSCEF